MIYFIVLLLMLGGVYAFDYRGHRRLSSVAYWSFFVVLVLIAGLRYRIGTDSIIYEKYYEDVPTVFELFKFKFESIRFEPGFMVFASIPRTFSSDFMWLQFFESIVINTAVFWFILKFTKNKFLCLSLYYIVLYLNLNTQVMREALAVAVFLFAWPFLRDGKWLWYYCLSLLAFFLHTSAFLMMFLPLLCLPGLNQFFILGKRTAIICVLVLALGVFISTRFSSVFAAMAITERMMDRVNAYNQSSLGGNLLNINGMVGVFLQYCLYPLLALYFINQAFRGKLRMKQREAEEKIEEEINDGKVVEAEEDIIENRKERKKKTTAEERWQMMVLIGVYLMIFSIPMFIFRRYFNYFGLFCLATVAEWALNDIWIRGKIVKLKPLTWVVVLVPYFCICLYGYAANANKSGTLKTYQIYYPYVSRLDPHLVKEREAIYRYLDAR